MKIADRVPMTNFMLLITSDNGISGYFDVSPYLEFEAFRPLQSTDEFMKIQNGGYFIEWDSGADLSADTIFTKWQISQNSATHCA